MAGPASVSGKVHCHHPEALRAPGLTAPAAAPVRSGRGSRSGGCADPLPNGRRVQEPPRTGALLVKKSLMTRPALKMLFPLALLGCPACDLKYLDQEVLLRHDPATDSLEVLLIYRGLTATGDSPDALGKALVIARRILAGRREFEVSGWPGHLDLDDPAAYQGLEPECAQALQAISIEAQEAFIDPEGRFSAYQLLRIPG